jgi:hypothetical protein
MLLSSVLSSIVHVFYRSTGSKNGWDGTEGTRWVGGRLLCVMEFYGPVVELSTGHRRMIEFTAKANRNKKPTAFWAGRRRLVPIPSLGLLVRVGRHSTESTRRKSSATTSGPVRHHLLPCDSFQTPPTVGKNNSRSSVQLLN